MKLTFQQIYDAVKPLEPVSDWRPEEKAKVTRLANSGCTVSDLLLDMDLIPKDWTADEKAAITRALGLLPL